MRRSSVTPGLATQTEDSFHEDLLKMQLKQIKEGKCKLCNPSNHTHDNNEHNHTHNHAQQRRRNSTPTGTRFMQQKIKEKQFDSIYNKQTTGQVHIYKVKKLLEKMKVDVNNWENQNNKLQKKVDINGNYKYDCLVATNPTSKQPECMNLKQLVQWAKHEMVRHQFWLPT